MKKRMGFFLAILYVLASFSACSSSVDSGVHDDGGPSDSSTSETAESTAQNFPTETETTSLLTDPSVSTVPDNGAEKDAITKTPKTTQAPVTKPAPTHPAIRNVHFSSDENCYITIPGENKTPAAWLRFAFFYIEMVDKGIQPVFNRTADYTKEMQPRAFTQHTENNNIVNRAIEFSLYCDWLEKEAARLGKESWFVINPFPDKSVAGNSDADAALADSLGTSWSIFQSCERYVLDRYAEEGKLPYTDAQKKAYCESRNLLYWFRININNRQDSRMMEEMYNEIMDTISDKKVSLQYLKAYIQELNEKYKKLGYEHIRIEIYSEKDFVDEVLVLRPDKSSKRSYTISCGLNYKYVDLYWKHPFNNMVIMERDFFLSRLYAVSAAATSEIPVTLNIDRIRSFYETREFTRLRGD